MEQNLNQTVLKKPKSVGFYFNFFLHGTFKRRTELSHIAYNGRVYGKCQHRTKLKERKVNIMKRLIQKLQKAFAIHIVMWRFISENRMYSAYEKYVDWETLAMGRDEVGTYDWFIWYVKQNKDFRNTWLGF